jgi:hypothetical protein
MKHNRAIIGLPILLVLLFQGTAIAQESYQLEHKFQKGKTYRYKSTSEGETTQEAMGREMRMTTGNEMTVRLVVEDVRNDGSMVLVVSTDSAVIRSKGPMMDTTMVMTNMMGKRMRITLTKTGTVRAREVIDSVHYESAGVAVRAPQREAMSFITLPEKPAKMGEKWTISKTDTVEMMGGTTVNVSDIDYTLVGAESKAGRDCLKITFTGKTTTTGKMNYMGMEMYSEGDGKVSGTVFFDHEQGLIVLVESTTSDERTMAMTGQQSMTIQMSSSGKSTQALLEE